MAQNDIESERQETLGRGGLRLPTHEWTDPREPGHLFFSFFKDLWRANGYGTDVRFYKSSASEWPSAFSDELVIPADGDKPLTILKGTFIPRNRNDVEYRARRNAESQEWGAWPSVDAGIEEHGIYVPQTTLGPLVPLLTVKYRHQFGGSGRRILNEPRVTRLGEHQEAYAFSPDNEESLPVQDAMRISHERFSEYMEQLFRETIEFIS